MTVTTATWAAADGRASWNDESLNHWSDVLTSELIDLFDPVEIWLFGSVARGDDSGDSDLDMMIVLDHYNTADAIDLKHRAIVATTTQPHSTWRSQTQNEWPNGQA
jgi:Nucleotidyltransferase domain